MIRTDEYYILLIQKFYSESIRRWLADQMVSPCSVEIHPAGKVGCLNKCPHCTGLLPPGMKSLEIIPISSLIDFIHSLPEYGVKKIVISGCRTEPFTYNGIGRVIAAAQEANILVGIHTTGELLTRDLMELVASLRTRSYIAFSIDSYDSPCYIEGHRPQKNRDPFPRIIENAYYIGRIKEELNSPLYISWHYLFLKCNVNSLEGIKRFIYVEQL